MFAYNAHNLNNNFLLFSNAIINYTEQYDGMHNI